MDYPNAYPSLNLSPFKVSTTIVHKNVGRAECNKNPLKVKNKKGAKLKNKLHE